MTLSNDTTAMGAAFEAASFKAKPAKKSAKSKPAKQAQPTAEAPAKNPRAGIEALNAKRAADKAEKEAAFNAAANSAANVAIGKELNSALDQIEALQTNAHAHAWALKTALCPNGKVMGENGRFLPHIAAFLAQVFAGDTRKDGAIRVAKTRFIQVVASTSEEKLGRTKNADAMADKAKRAAQHKGGAGQENPDDESSDDVSVSAERRQTIGASVSSISDRAQSISRIASEMPKSTRDRVKAELDQIFAELKLIKAANK